MEFKIINATTGKDNQYTATAIANFLHEHLEEYGDDLQDILQCIDYTMNPDKGGNIILGLEHEKIIGAVILNTTGMGRYIPENILVYIAVNNQNRGKGIGKQLMQEAIRISTGAIALHCEPNNPALHLYQKLGFTSKYLEMRLIK